MSYQSHEKTRLQALRKLVWKMVVCRILEVKFFKTCIICSWSSKWNR